jgi:RNA polymerase sigma factor (TIGR02999 family)
MSSPAAPTPVTQLLALARAGDPAALDQAYAAVYQELKQLARRQLRRERGALETTVLVHEAYLKLVAGEGASPDDRNHLLGLAARAMRQVLVDHARYVNAGKRDAGGPMLTLRPDAAPAAGPDALDILTVDDTIRKLHEIDPRVARVVELRCFGGCDVAEIARILELPEYTVRRDWRKARALLLAELGT